MSGGEDQVSPGKEKTSGGSGSLGGGIPLFSYEESQAQSHPDDDVLFGIESERNRKP